MCELKKMCKSCRIEKLLTEFRKCTNTKDGTTARCSHCIKHHVYEILDETVKRCSKCDVVKSKDLFYKSNRTKDSKQPQCKDCLIESEKINKSRRLPNIKPKTGFKICSKCKLDKHVDDFYANPNLSMGVHSECITCTKYKVSNWNKDNPDRLRTRQKYIPKEKIEKKLVTEKTCSYCNVIKPLGDFGKKTLRCNDCLREYTKNRSCTIIVSEKLCGKCKEVKSSDRFNKDSNTVTGLSSKCDICRKEDYEKRKHVMMARNKLTHSDKYKNDEFYRLVYTIRGRIRNSLSIYLKNNEKKSKHSEDILGCSWKEFKIYIESQFLSWMSWDNFGDACGNSPDYNCSWDLDHIIPVSWAQTNNELYALNHWSNFQPLCSKVNRWDKSGNITPLCNIELNLTVYSIV